MKFIERMCWAFFACCALVEARWLLLAALAALGWSDPDWPAWTQAVGATVGIGLAVWLPYKQKINSAALEVRQARENQKRICMAFRDELSILRARANTAPNLLKLQRDAPGEIFDTELPIGGESFHVFRATIGRLIEIDDEAVRRSVIEAYECAHAMAPIGALNNRRLLSYADLRREQRRLRNDLHDEEIAFYHNELVNLRGQMREFVLATIIQVDKALILLNAAVARFEEMERAQEA